VIEQYIRDIPDFPKPGIVFKDITPLLKDPEGLAAAIDALAALVDPDDYDMIVGIESRGFIFGTAVAYKLNKGFIPVRKLGKLPSETASVTYDLEYGSDTLELHLDALEPGERVLILDDLLATGGTIEACIKLIRDVGAVPIGAAFVIELSFLQGRDRMGDVPAHSLMIV
jgi:adenine phosphoribosyltransferase